MADAEVTVDNGAGTDFDVVGDTVDLGSSVVGLAQYVKLLSGAESSVERIGGDAANGLDVDVTRVSGTVTVDGSGVTQPVSGTVAVTGVATAANQSTEIAGLVSIDAHVDGIEALLTTIDADTGTIATEVAGLLTDTELRATPVPVSGTVGVTGVATAANQTTIIGHLDGVEGSLSSLVTQTDGVEASLTTLAGAVAGTEMQVDVVAALPAGTNAIGKLAANTGVDIGDVDVTSIIPGVGATNLGKAEDAVHASGDTGVMALAVRSDTAAATGANGDYVPILVDALGHQHVALPRVSASTDVSLASSATSAQLLAANTSRRGLMLTNTDANAVYLYYGTTATASKFTVKIAADGYWEMPQPIYTGRVDCLWAADGSGSLIGSEL